MIIGSFLCVFALLLFGYTRLVASVFIKFGTSAVILYFYSVLSLPFIDSRIRTQNNVLTIWLAVLSIYCIDFSINAGPPHRLLLFSLRQLTFLQTVMAVDRALIVDVLPSPEQPSAAAWAARMIFIGAIVGFYMYVSPCPVPPCPSMWHFTDPFSSIHCGTYVEAS